MDPTIQSVLSAAISFFVITLIFAAVYAACKSRRRKDPPQPTRTRWTRTAPSRDLHSISVSESHTFDPSLTRVAMPDLVKATRNFSTDLIVGDGGFGLVYRAKLPDGVTVAVKKLAADAFQGYREFRAETETLGKIRHENIVKILGYCATGEDRVLIYEFIENGSLDQWLYDMSSPDATSMSAWKAPLSWETRARIIKGVARGLCYMHNLNTPIIHRDIKASNVLLDSNFEAHIADFGLARRVESSHSHVSTQVAGTMGYMPPEYIHGATCATVMGDVYSFGVLMFEVATGKRPNWPVKDNGEEGKEVQLVEWATKMVSQSRETEMVDPRALPEGLAEGEVVEFFRIAKLCTREVPKSRPTMRDVVEFLNKISE